MSEKSRKGILGGLAAMLASLGITVEHKQGWIAQHWQALEHPAEEVGNVLKNTEHIAEDLGRKIHVLPDPVQPKIVAPTPFVNLQNVNPYSLWQPEERIRKAVNTAVLNYLESQHTRTSLEVVRQVAIDAARKQNNEQRYKLGDAVVTSIASSAAPIVYRQYCSTHPGNSTCIT